MGCIGPVSGSGGGRKQYRPESGGYATVRLPLRRRARTHTGTRELPAAPASAASRQWHQRPDMIRAITHAHRERRARELGTVCVYLMSDEQLAHSRQCICSLSLSLSLARSLARSLSLSLSLSLSCVHHAHTCTHVHIQRDVDHSPGQERTGESAASQHETYGVCVFEYICKNLYKDTGKD